MVYVLEEYFKQWQVLDVKKITMAHSIRCNCGKVKGQVKHTRDVNRCICYCADCQAFAHYLKREQDILNKMGGTSIVQTIPENVIFSEGIENLACIRLTPTGLLRWYAACCNTPIGNTPSDSRISFVGLIHNCLGSNQNLLDQVFGPIRMQVNTKYALGENRPKPRGFLSGTWRVMGMILKARLSGGYKNTPFFILGLPDVPIVTPKVLSEHELKDVMNAL